ncbi:hypothetical protein YC2023_062787 [Brassica napus]
MVEVTRYLCKLHDIGPLPVKPSSWSIFGEKDRRHFIFNLIDNGSEVTAIQQQNSETPKEPQSQKEEFPRAPSDHQSILVSLSSRSVWKGTVCERSHLFRIKYYGSFDKPLGRFLRDHLFDHASFTV